MDLLTKSGLHALLALLTCSALGVLTYSHTLSFPFLAWDDTAYVLQDPLVQQPSITHLLETWTSARNGVWYPLARSSHLVDVWLFGNNPFPHRLENLLLHIANSLLVFALALQLVRRKAPATPDNVTFTFAMLAAALFVVHPQHVEVVVWVTQRNELLATLFFLLCLLAYFHYTRAPALRRPWLYYSAILSAIAMTAKPTAVATPLVLVLLDVLYRQEMTLWQSAKEKWLFFTITGAACAASLLTHHDANALYAHDLYSLPQRIVYAGHNLGLFFGNFLFPWNLTPFHSMPVTITGHHPGLVLFNWIVLPGLLYVLYRVSRKALAFLLTWMVMVLPVSGIILFGSYGSGDRYMYMPSAILLAGLCADCSGFWPTSKKPVKVVQAFIYLAIVSGCSWLTIDLAKNWRDDITLWQYVTRLQPDAAYPRVYLAIRLREQNRISAQEAATQLEQAVALEPVLPGLNALVVTYTGLGDTGRIIQTHQRIVATYPHHSAFSKASLALYQMLHVIPGDGQDLLQQAMEEDTTLCTRIDRARQQIENRGLVPDASAFTEAIEQAKSAAACRSAP